MLRPEGLSQGLPTVSGKAVEDPVALCFPTVPLFPEASPGQALLLALGSFPVAVLGHLLQWAQVAPDPGSGHSVLSHHCPGASHPAQAQHKLNSAVSSCLTSPGLQYLGKWIYCSHSNDKLEIKRNMSWPKQCVWPVLALHAPAGAHCHLGGSRGHGLAWLCWAQPADWAGLGAQVFHPGVMGTPENWCQS